MPIKNDAAGLLRLARRADQQAAAQKQRAAGYVAAAVAYGATWAEVGAAFGVTRQAAHERFSPANRRRRRGTPSSVAKLCDTTSIGASE